MAEKLEKRVTFRLSTEQFESLKEHADKANISVSKFVLNGVTGKKIVIIDGLKPFISELKAIGRNINQLTTLANMEKISAVNLEEMTDQLARIYEKIVLMSGTERK